MPNVKSRDLVATDDTFGTKMINHEKATMVKMFAEVSLYMYNIIYITFVVCTAIMFILAYLLSCTVLASLVMEENFMNFGDICENKIVKRKPLHGIVS